MTNKEKYINLCHEEKSIPIFSQYWWLDAVCKGDNWDVILVYDAKKNLLASLPYYINNKYGFKRIKMPQLTQKLGPWFKTREFKSENDRLSHEKNIFTQIIDQIPEVSEFDQHFNYDIHNWLPFYWKGFIQTTRYTYILQNIKDYDLVYNSLDRSKKKNFRKAEKHVHVDYDLSVEEFYINHVYTLGKQNQKIEYSMELLKRIYFAATKRNRGKIFCARDSENNIHAAIFVVWDDNSAYDLISTIDPKYRNSGAATFIVMEAIKYTAKYVNVFDFEGSMIEGVERSFRKFGSKQMQYFKITKVFSKRLKLVYFLQDLIKRI